MLRFSKTLERGMKELEKHENITGAAAFDLFQSYGFPFELTQELAKDRGIDVSKDQFNEAQEVHRNSSRSASVGKFKGGLADTSDQVVKYHTATHLLQQALKDIFGDVIRQEGSNITSERLRFDTRLDHKPTEEELRSVESIINDKIKQALPVKSVRLPKEEAEKIGATSFFREKYGDEVNIYYIGSDEGDVKAAYSKEFCGGPHVENTSCIGEIKLYKAEKIGAQSVRIYAR